MLPRTPGIGPKNRDCPSKIGGVSRGGGEPPNFIKREKNAPRVCAKTLVLVLKSYSDPPPFQNPVFAPENGDSWQPLELL